MGSILQTTLNTRALTSVQAVAEFGYGIMVALVAASNYSYQKVGFEITGSLCMVGFNKNENSL